MGISRIVNRGQKGHLGNKKRLIRKIKRIQAAKDAYKQQEELRKQKMMLSEPVVPHVIEEGSREHVLSYDSQGRHCSEPTCEINREEEGKNESNV